MIIHDLEQNSPEWYAIRSGIPTASSFKKLVTGTGKDSSSIAEYARTLAAEKYAGKPLDKWEGNKFTERGHEMEPEAVDEYELINGVQAIEAGFVTSDCGSYGCSPDRLVGDDGALEIKSLIAHRHIEALQYIEKNGDIPPDYRSQAQGQILACEREWCDLMFFHPDLPSHTFRVVRDDAFQQKLKARITEVIKMRDQILRFLGSNSASPHTAPIKQASKLVMEL